MSANTRFVLTIGHSNHTIEAFVGLLHRHSITAVADVRSTPYSRFAPQFNKESLPESLKAHRLRYVFLGKELGGRSDDPSCYDNGRVQYGRVAHTALFRAGIDRVIEGAVKYRIALMCAEKEPLECHRTLLVGRALEACGVSVSHIHPDGRLESHRDAMLRLLDVTGVPQADLFRSQTELIMEAMARQELRIAYTDERLESGVRGDTK